MKVYIKYLLIFIEIILFSLIVFLGFKIYSTHKNKGNVKGIHIIPIDKNSIIFDNNSGNLKDFYEPKPNNMEFAKPEWLDYEVQYSINSDSLNERFDYSPDKDFKTFRIITLGDSFTFGSFVNTFENYSEQLEDMLNTKIKCSQINKFEVINLGVGGYDITYAVERFKKRGVKYNPDLVLWLVNFWNFDKVQELFIPLYKKYHEQGIPDFDKKTGKYIISNLILDQLQKEYGESKLIDFTKSNLNKFNSIFNGKLIIFGSKEELDSNRKRIIRDFVKTNPNYLYQEKISQFWDNPKYRLLDFHPNPEGHKIIAEDVYSYLLNNILTDCKEIN